MKKIIILIIILIFCLNYNMFSIDSTSDPAIITERILDSSTDINIDNSTDINNYENSDNSSDKIEEKKADKNDYKIALETSVGFGTGINFSFARSTYDSYGSSDTIQYEEYFSFNSLYLNIPFSLMFYFKKSSISIGLSINYNFFIFQNINYTETSYSYDNVFELQQSVNPNFKIKVGNVSKKIRLVCEMGLMISYYYKYILGDDAVSGYSGIEYDHYHLYHVYLGPRLSSGIELVYKNFSFEAGGFIGYLTGSTYKYSNQTYYAWDADIEFDEQQWVSNKDQFQFGFYISVNFIYFKKIK